MPPAGSSLYLQFSAAFHWGPSKNLLLQFTNIWMLSSLSSMIKVTCPQCSICKPLLLLPFCSLPEQIFADVSIVLSWINFGKHHLSFNVPSNKDFILISWIKYLAHERKRKTWVKSFFSNPLLRSTPSHLRLISFHPNHQWLFTLQQDPMLCNIHL